ncbi:DUF6538 domain-containing protein [Sphingomonas sp. GC_Shp_3]|uniref:DUF6538 domain-containing protein n=1 Tax=Sphingomonas sp. GC_Shp_3 TaxID=2937383 RepID=UPI003211AEB4
MPRLGSRVRIPSPAPATSKPLEVLTKPSKLRFSTKIVSTKRLHNDAARGAPSPRKCSENRRQGVYTRRLHNRPIGLCSKRGIFHYRRRVPTDLLTVWEGREVWRSLDTDSYAMALRRIHRIAADVESEFEKARASIGRLADPALIVTTLNGPPILLPWVPAAPQPPAPPPPSNRRTIGDVYDRFIRRPEAPMEQTDPDRPRDNPKMGDRGVR